jgi:hypothetical protein
VSLKRALVSSRSWRVAPLYLKALNADDFDGRPTRRRISGVLSDSPQGSSPGIRWCRESSKRGDYKA